MDNKSNNEMILKKRKINDTNNNSSARHLWHKTLTHWLAEWLAEWLAGLTGETHVIS